MSEKKSIFKRVNPHTLEFRQTTGCLSLFGIPFLLAGLFIMQIPLGIIPVGGESPPWYFLVLFGLPFTIVGAYLVFGVKGTRIDLSTRTVDQWWGLIVPLKHKIQPLDRYKMVYLSKVEGDSDSSDNYPIAITGGLQGDTLKIHAPLDYHEARFSAEELCRFLNFPLKDDSSGVETIRKPEELNESLRAFLRRSGQNNQKLPAQPAPMQCRIERTVEGYRIGIPWPNRGKASLFGVAFSLFFAAIATYYFLIPILTLPMHPALRMVFAAFLIIFFIFGPIWTSIRHIREKQKLQYILTLTPALLRLEEGHGRKKKSTEIPADEVEDVVMPVKINLNPPDIKPAAPTISLGETGVSRWSDGRPMSKILQSILKYAPHPGITIRSAKHLITIGRGLPEGELIYLQALIRKVIAG